MQLFNYLIVTRVDISFTINVVSQILDYPQTCHYDVTVHFEISQKETWAWSTLSNHGHIEIEDYPDAD